ncbi:MAG: ABC transporter permease, partial [Clostridium sp.]|nr:ABC transporter permease [Clostridium sp.]
QVLLMTLSTSLIFKISWGSSIPALFVLFTSIIFVVLGLGLLLCRFVKTIADAQLVCQMVVQISCMVGGSYIPLEYFPTTLKHIAYFMPQSWAVAALTDVVLKNKGLISILPNVGVLLLFAAAFFTAGVSTIRGTVES